MKLSYLNWTCLTFLVLSAVFFVGCGDEEAEVDPILGTWVGSSIQEDLGPIEIVVRINSLVEGQKSGDLNSELNDLSNCNPDIFICEVGTCATEWFYSGRSGSAYVFTERAKPNEPCADGAEITLSFSGDNQLRGTVAFDIDPGAPVEIETNTITLDRQ